MRTVPHSVDHSGLGDRSIFGRNLETNRVSEGISVHSADSSTVTGADLMTWGGGQFKAFSVDGGHTAELTAHDLAIAAQALAPGGLLILDDYFNVSWPGVSEGTNHFLLTEPAVEPVGSGHGKTFFADAEHADAYRAAMTKVAAQQGWRCTVQPFFAKPHVIVRELTARSRNTERVRSWGRRVPGLAGAVRAVRNRAA